MKVSGNISGETMLSAMYLWNSKTRKGNGEHPVQYSAFRKPKTFFSLHTWAGRHSCKRQQEAGGLLHITSHHHSQTLLWLVSALQTHGGVRDFSPFAALPLEIRHDSHKGIPRESSDCMSSFSGMWPLVQLENQTGSIYSRWPNEIPLFTSHFILFVFHVNNGSSSKVSKAKSSPTLWLLRPQGESSSSDRWVCWGESRIFPIPGLEPPLEPLYG